MDRQTNIRIFRPTPVRDVLNERAISCIAELSENNGIHFELAYQMAVGSRCASTKHPGNLTPPEMEALFDLNLVMHAWRETGDMRPPQDHLEFLSVLRRICGRVSFIGGVLTRVGQNIVERYDAELERRPCRYQ